MLMYKHYKTILAFLFVAVYSMAAADIIMQKREAAFTLGKTPVTEVVEYVPACAAILKKYYEEIKAAQADLDKYLADDTIAYGQADYKRDCHKMADDIRNLLKDADLKLNPGRASWDRAELKDLAETLEKIN